MPISEKQLAANRANAQKSTGPKTEEGKARAALNGCQSIITDLSTIMTHEDHAAQTAFVETIVRDFDPQGAVERQLANTIALDYWRLNRIKTVEENVFALGLILPGRVFTNENVEIENAVGHAWTYLKHSDRINRISLYESRLNRCIKANMDLLETRQAKRKDNEKLPQPEAAPKTRVMTASAVAAKAEAIEQPARNESLKPGNGFASATSESSPQPTPEAPPELEKAA